MRHTLAEWIVVQVAGQVTYGPVRNGNRIDQTLVAHLFRAKQAQVIRTHLDVFQPAVSPKVPTLDSKRNLVSRILDGFPEAYGKLRRHTLVGIDVKNPRMPKWNVRERPTLV